MAKKMRIDDLLVTRELFPAIRQARSAIMAGDVFVDEIRIDKAGASVAVDATIRLRVKEHPYVGRGGLKLAGTLDAFSVVVAGVCALDIGASTGGFTDCLLQRGARKVYALDVGEGLLDWKLRHDKRVAVLEGINIRHFDESLLEDAIDIVTIDVSFISLKLVVPVAKRIARDDGIILALIKPQFEAPKELVEPGGIIREPATHRKIVDNIAAFCAQTQGLSVHGAQEAHPAGRDGNKEFFLCCRKIAES